MALRPLTKDRWNELIALEIEVFGPHEQLFTWECLERLCTRYGAGIEVAIEDDRLFGYLAMFPLTREGVQDLRRRDKFGVCGMCTDAICATLDGSEAFYFEVIAAAPDATRDVRRELMQEMAKKIGNYTRDVYSCPVTAVGLRIMDRMAFKPVSEPGLDRLYVLRKG